MPREIADTKPSFAKHRRTYHIQDDLHEKVKSYAYWERLKISDIVNMALDDFFKSVKVRKIPKNRKLSLKSNVKAGM